MNATIASFSGCCVERPISEHALTNSYSNEWLEDTYKSNLVKRVNVKDLVGWRGRGLDVRLYAGFCGDADNVSVARKEKHSREAHERVRFCV